MDAAELNTRIQITLEDCARDPRFARYERLVRQGYFLEIVTSLRQSWLSASTYGEARAASIASIIDAIEYGEMVGLPDGQETQIFNTAVDNIIFRAKRP